MGGQHAAEFESITFRLHPAAARDIRGVDPVGDRDANRLFRGRDASGTNRPSGSWVKAAFFICKHLQLKDGLRNLYQCLVRLARWRATE